MFIECKLTVKKQVAEAKKELGIKTDFDYRKIGGFVDRMFNKTKQMVTLEEYESCSPEEKDFLNSCKKLLKRVDKPLVGEK